MLTVKCPTCNTQIEWSAKNAFKPFCCERCKLIDLGAWADGTYSIPDQPVDLDQIPPEEIENANKDN